MKSFTKNLFFFLIMTAELYATVECTAVNHITKELYLTEDDNCSPGFLGLWEVIPEGRVNQYTIELINKNYHRTQFPYKAEFIFISILIAVIVIFRIKKH